ncbi:MAG: acyltransferase [Chloroflexota bacterium]
MKRIPALDGIRGIAILFVLVWHYFTIQAHAEPNTLLYHPVEFLVKATRLAWSGVDLFFVLSGFLIGGILLDNRLADSYYKTFYVRRALRILPLYLLMVASYIVLVKRPPENLQWLYENSPPIWSFLTFTQNYVMGMNEAFGGNWLGVTWSLAIEEQFYLILPFLIRTIKKEILPYFLVAAILVGPVSRFFIEGLGAYVYTFCRTDALMLGVLVAWLVRRPGAAEFLRRHLGVLVAVFIVLSIGAVGLTFNVVRPGRFFNYFWLALLYGNFILLAFLLQDSRLGRFLAGPIPVWFGLRSYCIYLIHQGVSGLWHLSLRHGPPEMSNPKDVYATILSFVTVLVLAELSYRFIETPILNLGHRFRYQRTDSGTASA